MKEIRESIFPPKDMKKVVVKRWQRLLLYFLKTHIYTYHDEKTCIYTTTYYKLWRQCYYVTRVSTLVSNELDEAFKRIFGPTVTNLIHCDSEILQGLTKGKKTQPGKGYIFSVRYEK